MSGWMWIVIGIGLCVAELIVVSGFFLFLLGLSAIVLGLLALTGLLATWPLQAIVFCAISVLTWFVFGNRLQSAMGKAKDAEVDTKGKVIKVAVAIAPGELGSGELWGSTWRLKNVGDDPILSGSECVVVEAEGVTLHVTRKR